MKQKKRFKFSYLLPLLALIIFIGVAVLLFYEQDCKFDKECFDESFSSCKKAKIHIVEEGNIFEYRIAGSRANNCIVKVAMIEVDKDSRQEVIDAFQGKTMTCSIPRSDTFETEEVLQYCSGPLKEAILELIIQKMYNILAENLGDIISQLQTK